jgi:transcriptional regulator with XRE-family HTH domain
MTEIMPTNRGYQSSIFSVVRPHESRAIDLYGNSRMGGVDYKKVIGERIRKARDARGWSQAELARETGDLLSDTRIGNYEVGFRMPGPSEVVILGHALGVKPSYLMALDDSQVQISPQEEALIRNWRTLSEKERMEVFRSLETKALQSRDPVSDRRVAQSLGATPNTPKKPARRKAK